MPQLSLWKYLCSRVGLPNLCSPVVKTSKMKKTNFTKCSLKEVDFEEADLSSANFNNCDLYNTRFINTNLEKTDFCTATNYTFDPEINKIKGARFAYSGISGLLAKYNIDIEFE